MAYRTPADFEDGNPNNEEFDAALERLRTIREANISVNSMIKYLIFQVRKIVIDKAKSQESFNPLQNLAPVLSISRLHGDKVLRAMLRVNTYFESSNISLTLSRSNTIIIHY